MKTIEKIEINLMEKESRYIGNVVMIFTVLMLSVFPLYYRNYYSDILNVKYQFCYVAIITMMLLIAIIKIDICMKMGRQYCCVRVKKMGKNLSWKNYTWPEYMMLLFCITALISTFTSDYFYESFWGNEGRYSGLFLWILYGLMFAFVSRKLKFKKWMIEIFLVSGMVVCLLGIADYFYLDPLGFKINIYIGHRDIFTSTIGNVNSFSAIALMYSGAAMAMFGMATNKDKPRTVLYAMYTVITFFALYTSRSDNAFLGLAALFAFLPFCLFRKKEGILRYFVILALFLTCGKILAVINMRFPEKVIGMDSISGTISTLPYLGYIVIAMWFGIGIIYGHSWFSVLKKGQDSLEGSTYKGLRWAWVALLAVAFAAFLFVAYDINIAKNVDRYGSIGHYFLWNDDWGTHRGFIWRVALENYMKFSPVHKIFGYGPETFGIITKTNNSYEMLNKYGEIYDNAHNGFLQYFITMGPISLISYIGLLLSSAWRVVKQCKNNPAVMAILFAAVGYVAQEIVSIDQPVVMPLFLLLISMGNAASRSDKMES